MGSAQMLNTTVALCDVNNTCMEHNTSHLPTNITRHRKSRHEILKLMWNVIQKDKRHKNERGEPVFLMDHLVQNAFLLHNGENFSDLAEALRKFPECVPMSQDGDRIYIKIVGTKKCHSKCKYAKCHNKALTSTQIEIAKKLLAKMRA